MQTLLFAPVQQKPFIRVAAYQATAKSSLQERKQQILDVLRQADQQQMDFVCFPEGFLTGYYAKRELAVHNALTEAEFQEWLAQTASFKVTAIIGFNEREGDKIFDAAAVIEEGKLLGIQRKHYLYHDYFSSDSRFSVMQSKGVTFGVVICLDTNYFEPSRLLALQGAVILFTPMCNKVPLNHPFALRPPHYSHFVARTHENRCWLIGADWIWPQDGKSICPGHSVIYDPDGKEIARSQEQMEQYVVTDIPQERLFYEKGRRMWGSQALAQQLATFMQEMVCK